MVRRAVLSSAAENGPLWASYAAYGRLRRSEWGVEGLILHSGAPRLNGGDAARMSHALPAAAVSA